MTVNKEMLMYYSGNNYLKRSEFFGTKSLTVPSGFTFNTIVIDHNLGNIPFYISACDINNDGIIWSTDYVEPIDKTVSTGFSTVRNYVYVSENSLKIVLGNSADLSQSGTRKFYYVIYLDYAT